MRRVGRVRLAFRRVAYDHAVADPDPEHPVKIHFVIDGMIGGLDVYRL